MSDTEVEPTGRELARSVAAQAAQKAAAIRRGRKKVVMVEDVRRRRRWSRELDGLCGRPGRTSTDYAAGGADTTVVGRQVDAPAPELRRVEKSS